MFFAKFRSHRAKNEKVMTENLSQLSALVVITEPPLTDLTAPHKQASPPLRINRALNRALRFGGDHVGIASARIQISS